jgi:hypothetical protein
MSCARIPELPESCRQPGQPSPRWRPTTFRIWTSSSRSSWTVRPTHHFAASETRPTWSSSSSVASCRATCPSRRSFARSIWRHGTRFRPMPEGWGESRRPTLITQLHQFQYFTQAPSGTRRGCTVAARGQRRRSTGCRRNAEGKMVTSQVSQYQRVARSTWERPQGATRAVPLRQRASKRPASLAKKPPSSLPQHSASIRENSC